MCVYTVLGGVECCVCWEAWHAVCVGRCGMLCVHTGLAAASYHWDASSHTLCTLDTTGAICLYSENWSHTLVQ